MRCMKISTALLAVPLCLGALACESDTATEESLVAPPGPSFKHEKNGDACVVSAGVGQKLRGHTIVVTGTAGPDNIDCSAASLPVQVSTGKGNDQITGSPFDDVLSGGPDCDVILAGNGNDLVDGGPGDDMCGGLFGQAGDDHIKGGTGDDFLGGGIGDDECEGGKGTDQFSSCDECSDPDGDCPVG